MNRRDLQELARTRLNDAKVLFVNQRYSGAYYLAGYAVECALKAVIAKETLRFEFPDKQRVAASHTHDLKKLAQLAGLEASRKSLSERDVRFSDNWDVVVRWSEVARYRLQEKVEAEALIQAVSQRRHGVMAWLTQIW